MMKREVVNRNSTAGWIPVSGKSSVSSSGTCDWDAHLPVINYKSADGSHRSVYLFSFREQSNVLSLYALRYQIKEPVMLSSMPDWGEGGNPKDAMLCVKVAGLRRWNGSWANGWRHAAKVRSDKTN